MMTDILANGMLAFLTTSGGYPIYVGLSYTDPMETMVEPDSSTGYARVLIPTNSWSIPEARITRTTTDITFPIATTAWNSLPLPLLSYVLFSSTGDVWYWDNIQGIITPTAGNTVILPAGSISIRSH